MRDNHLYVLVTIRPESITVVDAETRNQWVIETAKLTFDRHDSFEDSDNQYATMAREQYGDDVEGDAAVEALDNLGRGDETNPDCE